MPSGTLESEQWGPHPEPWKPQCLPFLTLGSLVSPETSREEAKTPRAQKTVLGTLKGMVGKRGDVY